MRRATSAVTCEERDSRETESERAATWWRRWGATLGRAAQAARRNFAQMHHLVSLMRARMRRWQLPGARPRKTEIRGLGMQIFPRPWRFSRRSAHQRAGLAIEERVEVLRQRRVGVVALAEALLGNASEDVREDPEDRKEEVARVLGVPEHHARRADDEGAAQVLRVGCKQKKTTHRERAASVEALKTTVPNRISRG